MTKPRIMITKLDAARRQLETAIHLYFSYGDFIAIHTLAFAAFSLTRNLCDKTSRPESFTKWMESEIHPNDHKGLITAINKAGNFFKHADKDSTTILEYIPEQYEFILRYALHMYEGVTSELTMPMAAFKIWYSFNHPASIPNPELRDQIPQMKTEWPSERSAFYDQVAKTHRLKLSRIIEQGG